MTFASLYAIIVGVAMIGQWSLLLVKRQVPELKTEPVSIRFHITAEFITATALLVGGFGLLLDSSWGLHVYLVSIGMLLYTLINSPGYFAQKREWRMVSMFTVLIILALVSLGLVL